MADPAARRLYFDHNAWCPLRPEARDALEQALADAGPANASSAHAEGRAARRRLDDAREELAGLLGARPDQVVFTSVPPGRPVLAARPYERSFARGGLRAGCT